jgi:hypothetical protein
MLRVKCVRCRIDGILLADESRDIPHCLQCGQPFQVDLLFAADRRPKASLRLSDELITTWLAEGPALPRPPRCYDFVCRTCGYAGPTPSKDRWGRIVCPACWTIERPPRRFGRSRTVCLECGLVFELSASDRGRTVLCPGCNYFLGCLMPIERERHKPFWSWR